MTVRQISDTLFFYNQETVVERRILGEKKIHLGLNQDLVTVEKAKIAPDQKFYLLYSESFQSEHAESSKTQLRFFRADQKQQWAYAPPPGRVILFSLTEVFEHFIVIGHTFPNHTQPQLEIVDYDLKNKRTIVPDRDWQQMVKFVLSPNRRYFAAHVKNLHNTKLWDYILFLDLQSGASWNVIFPFCLSCTRGILTLKASDDGRLDVKYKNEHRIYSARGDLLDAYTDM